MNIKKIFTTFSLLIATAEFIYADGFHVINSPGAGQLVLDSKAQTAKQLKIVGEIDARDFMTLKNATISYTEELDLSQTTIKAYNGSQGCYAPITKDWIVTGKEYDHSYPANTLPIHAFTICRDNSFNKWHEGSKTLKHLILPTTIQGLEPYSIYKNTELEAVECPTGAGLKTSGCGIYTRDMKHLVFVLDCCVDRLDVAKQVEQIDSCAFLDVKIGCIKFHSPKIPVIKGGNKIKTAYILTDYPKEYAAIFPEFDVISEIPEVTIDNVVSGTLLEALGNSGLTRNDVRNIRVSGTLSQEDIANLLQFPNLHIADLSATTTTATTIEISKDSKLCKVALPKSASGYWLDIYENFLYGNLVVPEGVSGMYCNNTRFSEVTFPSTLTDIEKRSFYNSSTLKRVDMSKCSMLAQLDNVFSGSNINELLLPPNLKFFNVSGLPITNLVFPKSLVTLYAANLGVSEITLFENIKNLLIVNMAQLKNVDLSKCENLKGIAQFLNNCPNVESVDLSQVPLTSIEGFNDCGIRDVTFPSCLKRMLGFSNANRVTSLNFSNCYALENLEVGKCESLESISLPPSTKTVTDFAECTSLKSVTCASVNPPTFNYKGVSSVLGKATLIVPNGKTGAYKMGNAWCDFGTIKEGGYAVDIKTSLDDQTPFVWGCGLYEKGAVVNLKASTLPINKIQDYCVEQWTVNGASLPYGENTFVVDQNTIVYAIYGKGGVNKDNVDLAVEFELSKDMAEKVEFKSASWEDKLYVYRIMEDGSVSECTPSFFVQPTLLRGKQTIYVVGNVISANINRYFSDDITVNSLYVKDNSTIEELEAPKCSLKEIHLNVCPNLKCLRCDRNNLISLDLSNCTNLQELDCSNNKLTSLKLSDKAPINMLSYYNNSIAYSFMTPTLYQIITNGYSESKPLSHNFYIDADEVNKTGVLDLSHEFYGADGTPTIFEFAESQSKNVINEANAVFKFTAKGVYNLTIRNAAYPKLIYKSSFEVSNPTSSIADSINDTIRFCVNKGTVTISGLTGTAKIEFVDLSGHVIDTGISKSGAVILHGGNAKGVMIVKITTANSSSSIKLRL